MRMFFTCLRIGFAYLLWIPKIALVMILLVGAGGIISGKGGVRIDIVTMFFSAVALSFISDWQKSLLKRRPYFPRVTMPKPQKHPAQKAEIQQAPPAPKERRFAPVPLAECVIAEGSIPPPSMPESLRRFVEKGENAINGAPMPYQATIREESA